MIWRTKTGIRSVKRKRTGLIRSFVVCKREYKAVSTEERNLSATEVANI